MIPRARDAEAKVPIQIMVRPPPRPGSLARRAALQRSFLSLFATSAILPAAIRTLPASAAKYTVVPSGTVAEKEARLSEVEKLFLENPDDPYVFGERAQLDYDLSWTHRLWQSTKQEKQQKAAESQQESNRETAETIRKQ